MSQQALSQQAAAQKTVLITGASSGIGYATAQVLARAGYTVYASARKVEALKSLEALGCRPLQLDATLERSRVDAVRQIEAEHGAVDILVNNAGYGLSGVVEELELEALRREFETNVFGLVRLSQLVLPAMRAKGWGRIVNVGSAGGSFTAPGVGAYHASKYAVEAFSDALRMERKLEALGWVWRSSSPRAYKPRSRPRSRGVLPYPPRTALTALLPRTALE